jgi:hypothetical protein
LQESAPNLIKFKELGVVDQLITPPDGKPEVKLVNLAY